MRIDFEAGVYGSGGGDGTWGEDGRWWGDRDVDLQAMGKSLEWDLCGLASAVSWWGWVSFSFFFSFSIFNYFKILMILLIINIELLIWCFSCSRGNFHLGCHISL